MQLKVEVLELIYEVASGESDWEEVLEVLKKTFSANFGFILIKKQHDESILISTIPQTHKVWKSNDENYFDLYPWKALLSNSGVTINSSKPSFSKNKYEENKPVFSLDSDGSYHTCGGLFKTKNDIKFVLGFPREKKRGKYQSKEAILMAFYSKQIVKALELEGVLGNSLPCEIYEGVLINHFSLSHAESRLILELFKHGNLPEAAKSLNRSYHTVRNQMKSVFKKTDTNNQIELFKFLVINR